MDTVKNRERSPVVVSLDQVYESADNLTHAVQIAVCPIRSRIQSLLAECERVAVAIAGGSAVGKSDFFTPALIDGLSSTLVFSEDDYCVGNSVSRQRFGTPNLHVPEDYDPALLARHVAALKRGEEIEKPVYSYKIRERVDTTRVSARQVLVVEGEFLLHPPLSDEFDIKVFINSDDHSRFVRRMIRPRRNPDQTDVERMMEYFRLSFPHYNSHIAPTMANADFVIENGYHPEEGHARIENYEAEVLLEGSNAERSFMAIPSDTEKQIFQRRYFTHSRKRPSEVLYVHSNASGNRFRYSCGAKDRSENGVLSPWVTFNLGETPIDLTDIGYTPTVPVEGQECCAAVGNSTVRLIRLSEKKAAIQITQPTDASGDVHQQQFIKRLIRSGLTKSTQTLDEWLQS